jgi:hypothetical protein
LERVFDAFSACCLGWGELGIVTTPLLGDDREKLGVDEGFEALEGGVVPGVGGLAPAAGLFIEEIGEVGAAEALFGREVDEGLGGGVEVEDGLLAVAGPLDGGDVLAVFEGGAGVDEHGVEDGVFLGLAGAVAGVEVAGGTFVLEDGGPGDGGGVGGEEGAARGEGEGIHACLG